MEEDRNVERALLCAGLALGLGCGLAERGADPGDGPFSGVEDTGAVEATGGGGVGNPTGQVSSSADGDGMRFDVGAGTGDSAGEGGVGTGCDKVDFLFVIDNSGSMEDEQANLKRSFGGFIDTIAGTLQAQDYHVMAVSTDNGQGGSMSSTCTNGDCSCSPAPACCDQVCMSATSCNGVPCGETGVTQCDLQYGAGQIHDERGNDCGLQGGRRYMTAAQPDLKATFDCVATVGTYGSGDEKPMLALGEAVSDGMNADGGCNAGFLRDDAILVVTFVTDEEDDSSADFGFGGGGSPGDPPQWVADLIAAKGGNPGAIVVLGLIGDGDQPGGICQGAGTPGGGLGAEPAPRLRAFVESFDNGLVGSVCAPDYTPFFAQAVSVIDVACDDFVPVG